MAIRRKIPEPQSAFLEALTELCKEELTPYKGSMSEIEHSLALNQKMRNMAVMLYNHLYPKPNTVGGGQ